MLRGQLHTLSSVICGGGSDTNGLSRLGGIKTKDLLARCESEEAILQVADEDENLDDGASLTIQLGELRDKLGRMEGEMNIVTEESRRLQTRLANCEKDLQEKVEKCYIFYSISISILLFL